jgi:hypothetical protein
MLYIYLFTGGRFSITPQWALETDLESVPERYFLILAPMGTTVGAEIREETEYENV